MSESRKIIINESLLSSSTSSSGNKTKKNIYKQNKPKPVIKPNSLKKTLLEKIKKHQQHEKISKNNSIMKNDNIDVENKEHGFHDSFMNSLEYLNKLSEKNKQLKQEKRQKNKTLKTIASAENKIIPSIQEPSDSLVSVELPTDFDNPYYSVPTSSPTTLSILPNSSLPIHSHPSTLSIPPQTPTSTSTTSHYIKQDIPYGCLKGGSKPTYREYHNKTLKKKPIIIQNNSNSNCNSNINISNNNNNLSYRQQKLAELKKSYKKIRQKKRTIRKSTYKLGKINGKLSVLIKNNNTRRKIKSELGLLKQKSLVEIKKYLYDKNLIKIGSTAPNDVLRILYEQSILAGDVTNIANDVQIHNFLNN